MRWARPWLTHVSLLLLVALILSWTPAAGQNAAQSIAASSLSLVESDLPAGFQLDPSASTSAELPGGGSLRVAVFRRPAGSGAVLIKHTVNSLLDAASAQEQYARLPAFLADQGFTALGSPGLGDESSAHSSPDVLDGQAVVYQTVAYRLSSVVSLVTVVGPPQSVVVDDAVGLARVSLARSATALGLPAPAGPPAAAPPPSSPPAEAPASQPAAAAPPPSAPATTPAGPPGILLQGTVVDSPEIGSNLRLGGFSGLVPLDASGTLFLTVTDRGPNDELGDGKDRKMTFPEPTYSPSILKIQLLDGQVRILERTPLKLPSGYTDPITGSELISGLSNGRRDEVPYSKNARDRLPYDPNGLDTEGLVLDRRDGSYWICEEYGPSILRVAPDGTIQHRLVPGGLNLDAPGQNVHDILPRDLARRKPNRGFEGLSMSPDGSTLFAIMQSPLSNPDEKTGESSRNVRLVTLDISRPDSPRLTGMYVYVTEPASRVGGDQDDVKVGDLAALSSSSALVAERDNEVGGRHKMVYQIDLGGATNLLERPYSGKKTLEELKEADLRSAGVKPVGKTAVADLAAYGYSPEKLEGLALVDERTIAVVNDNDFGFAGFDDDGLAIPSGSETRLVVVRLERAVR